MLYLHPHIKNLHYDRLIFFLSFFFRSVFSLSINFILCLVYIFFGGGGWKGGDEEGMGLTLFISFFLVFLLMFDC